MEFLGEAELAPPQESAAEAPTFAAPDDTDTYTVQKVFFGTDRELDGIEDNIARFGFGRADALTIGAASITIPRYDDKGKRRKKGTVPRPKDTKALGITLWRGKETADEHFTIYNCEVLEQAEFLQHAGHEAAEAERFKGAAFIFMHGFNVTFDAALFRAAQMAHDIGFDGPAFMYSWPAKGRTSAYFVDKASAEQAAPHLDEFIDLVLKTPGVQKLHLVVHSMGNEVLSTLVSRVGLKIQDRPGKTLDQLVLAAPDIDVSLFDDMAEHFARHANGVTMYACATDFALLASKKAQGYPRAGDVPDTGPALSPHVDTIDITSQGTGVFALRDHSLYANDTHVLNDLGLLLKNGTRPPTARMPIMQEIETDRGTYWLMP